MVLQTPRHPGPQETSLFQLTAKMRLSVSDLWDLPTRESKQAGGGCHMGGLSGPLGIEPRPPDSKFSKADGSKIRLDKCRLPTEVFWEAPASLLRQTPLSFPLDNGLIFFLCNFFCVVGGSRVSRVTAHVFHVSQHMCRGSEDNFWEQASLSSFAWALEIELRLSGLPAPYLMTVSQALPGAV